MSDAAEHPGAVVAYIERADGRILCVWHRKYGGWCLPGGKIDPGEQPIDACERELREETGLEATRLGLFCVRESSLTPGRMVHVFRVWAKGVPREAELGSPVTWLTREEFLRFDMAPKFYEELFPTLPIGVVTYVPPKADIAELARAYAREAKIADEMREQYREMCEVHNIDMNYLLDRHRRDRASFDETFNRQIDRVAESLKKLREAEAA